MGGISRVEGESKFTHKNRESEMREYEELDSDARQFYERDPVPEIHPQVVNPNSLSMMME